MDVILANYTASITELKKTPTELIKNAGDETIAILNHNKPSAYLVPSKTYKKLMETLEGYQLSKIVEDRLNDNETPIEVSLDKL